MKSEEFTTEFAKRVNLDAEETQRKIDELVTLLTDKLIDSVSLTIRDIGEFSILSKKERVLAMPEVGKERVVPAKPMVIFRAGERLKETIQKLKLEE